MEDATSSALISFEARLVGWLSVGFMLDIADLGRMGAPELDALLVAALLEANVNRLNRDPELQAAYAQLDRAPPDELRRPLSINALAASLHIPFETARRHVNKLIRQGYVTSGPGGVYVPAAVVVSPPFVAAAKARYERVFQFHAELVLVGMAEPLPFTVLPVDHPQAPVRAIGRILSDYFFRMIDIMLQRVPDPLTGLLLLDIVRAGSERVSPLQAAAALRTGWVGEAGGGPVRVAHLSRRRGIPYETTRRHVGWLLEHGYCRRDGVGLTLAPAYRDSPALEAVTGANLVNVRRLYRLITGLAPGRAPGAAQPGRAAGF